jgi:hypothetical protein
MDIQFPFHISSGRPFEVTDVHIVLFCVTVTKAFNCYFGKIADHRFQQMIYQQQGSERRHVTKKER